MRPLARRRTSTRADPMRRAPPAAARCESRRRRRNRSRLGRPHLRSRAALRRCWSCERFDVRGHAEESLHLLALLAQLFELTLYAALGDQTGAGPDTDAIA